MRLYLAHHHNLADFEIKGRIGHLLGSEYVWAQYGKLPKSVALEYTPVLHGAADLVADSR